MSRKSGAICGRKAGSTGTGHMQAGRQAGRQAGLFGRTTLDKKLFTLGAIGLRVFFYCFDVCLGIIVGACW